MRPNGLYDIYIEIRADLEVFQSWMIVNYLKILYKAKHINNFCVCKLN